MGIILDQLLGISVEALKADLQKIERTWYPGVRNLWINHNHRDTIFVYGGIEYKAYVPKRYHAWNVTFIEWNGDRSKIDGLSMYEV